MLDATLAGEAPAEALSAQQALESGLTAEELDHVVNVDWSTLDEQGLLGDAILRKAMRLVEGIGGAGVVTAASDASPQSQSMVDEPGVVPQAYECKSDCATCLPALEAAIKEVQVKIAALTAAGGYTCAALAAAGGAPGLFCGAFVLFMNAEPFEELALELELLWTTNSDAADRDE